MNNQASPSDWSSVVQSIPPQLTIADLSTTVVTRLARALYDSSFVSSSTNASTPNSNLSMKAPDGSLRSTSLKLFGDLTEYSAFSGLHEPVLMRNQPFCHFLSTQVINEKGELKKEALNRLIIELKAQRFCLDPSSLEETHARAHALSMLEKIAGNGSVAQALFTLHPPEENRMAKQRVAETILERNAKEVTVAQTRVAALTMLLSYFRQNVGSCFATAPGIVIQRYEPEMMIQDLQSLFSRGRIERYFAGTGLEVPFSRSVGVGDFKRPLKVKTSHLEQQLRRVLYSPALLAGLEELAGANQLDQLQNLNTEQRVKVLTQWLMPPVTDYLKQHLSHFITVEQLIRWVCLRLFDLKPSDLERQQFRPEPIIRDGILIQNPFVDETATKIETCQNAIERLEAAFKRFGENPLLKAWEYTLASLTDHQSGFTKTNLYHSLGVDHRQPYGIGQIVDQSIEKLLDEYNRKITHGKEDHYKLVMLSKQLASRLSRMAGDSRFSLEVEYNKVIGDIYSLEIRLNEDNRCAHYLSQLFNHIMSQYFDWFAEYFQEIYDPDLHTDKADQYADAPAGFRLYYKHGYEDSSHWQAISSEQEFINAIREFFRSTESQLVLSSPPEVQSVLRELVTEIMMQLQKPEFITQAKQRLQNSNFVGNEPDHLRTPWAYVSGGYVDKLLGAYFKLESLPAVKKPVFKDAVALFQFLAKEVQLRANDNRMIPVFKQECIICSPTHAFILQPYQNPFCQVWQQPVDPIAWLQQQLVHPSQQFFRSVRLTAEKQRYLMGQLTKQFAELMSDTEVAVANAEKDLNEQQVAAQRAGLMAARNLLLFLSKSFTVAAGEVSAYEFSHRLLQQLNAQLNLPKSQLQGLIYSLDALLYQQMPLFDRREALAAASALFKQLGVSDYPYVSIVEALWGKLRKEQISLSKKSVETTTLGRGSTEPSGLASSQLVGIEFVGSEELFKLVMLSLALGKEQIFSDQDVQRQVVELMRTHGYAPPAPILFADTNWFGFNFGFALSPSTEQLQVWQCNALGHQGRIFHLDWRKSWQFYF